MRNRTKQTLVIILGIFIAILVFYFIKFTGSGLEMEQSGLIHLPRFSEG